MILKKYEFSRNNFLEAPQYKISRKICPVEEALIFAGRQADRQRETNSLILLFMRQRPKCVK